MDRDLRVPSRIAAILGLAPPWTLLFVLNGKSLFSWWVHDDPCLLASAARGGIAAHFFEPEVWRGLSGSVLMPWTILSLGVDQRLFGLEPAAFYAHQLLSFGVLLGLAYALLLRWSSLSAPTASLALVLFVASAPGFAVARQLMNRHYLEGLVLFLGALALYLRSVETDRLGFAWAAAALYLLATTAKEVFVPLAAILPFLPAGGWKRRLVPALPFAAAALLYVPWRLYMLGWANSLSGYAARADAPERVDPGALLRIVGLGDAWQLAAAALVLAAVLGFGGLPSRNRLALVLVSAATLALPLLPVAGQLAPRHFLVPTLGAGVLAGRFFERWRGRGPAVCAALALALVLFALYTLTRSPIWRDHERSVERHRTEGAFVLDSSEDGVLLTRLGDPNYLKCVAEIRRDVVGRNGGPGFCGDVCWCAEARAGSAFWRAEDGRIVPFDPPRQACSEDRGLSVEMSYERGTGRLGWRFGPHRGDRGSYQVLLVSGEAENVSAPVPVASAGEAPFTLREPFRWIVRYRSSEGWQTYSPILTLDPEKGSLSWP